MKRIVLFLSLICMISTTSWTADDDNTYIPKLIRGCSPKKEHPYALKYYES